MNNNKDDSKDIDIEDAAKEIKEEDVKEEDVTTDEAQTEEAQNDEAQTDDDEVSEAVKEECDSEESVDSKSKLFSRKKEKKDKKDVKIDELNERLVRLMAEYDNYRKRTDREKSSMYEMGVKSVVEKILPVIDNFERGFDCVEEDDKDNPFIQGMQKIYEQFTGTLGEIGITAIEAVGKEFDPNIHNAVMHVDDESVGANIVVEEFQKGYMYRDAVVRYSMVKVAN